MTVYADCTSLYVTMKYTAKGTSPWAGEMWQTGFRILVRPTTPFDLGSGRVDPPTFGVQDAAVTRSITNWDIYQGFSGVADAGSVITDSDVDEILTAGWTFATALKIRLGAQYEFDSVKIYPMLAGGGTPFRPGVTATSPTICTPIGTGIDPSASTMLPPDIALALSLSTGTRGPSGRGRLFLGGISAGGIGADGLILSAAATPLADATATFFDDLRGINSGGIGADMRYTPVIYTRSPNKAGLLADTASVINSVRVSDETDTQRRRDRQRNDIWVTSALTP